MLGLDLEENKTLQKEEPSKSSVKKKVTIATEAKKITGEKYVWFICMILYIECIE